MRERKGLCFGQREESFTRGEGVQEEEQEEIEREYVYMCVRARVRESVRACECARRRE